MRNLILNYWKSPYEERVKEVHDCIAANIESNLFDRCLFFVQKEQSNDLLSFVKHLPISKTSIKLLECSRNVTYNEIFGVCNTLYSSKDDINVLANSDIQYDESIKLADKITSDDFYCLTRYNDDVLFWNLELDYVPKCGSDSQDVWIWRGKNKIKTTIDIYLGVPGCDNRISYEALKCGYIVSNPSLSIKTHHKHTTNLKGGHSENVNIAHPTPFVFTKPIKLEDTPESCMRICATDREDFSWLGETTNNKIKNLIAQGMGLSLQIEQINEVKFKKHNSQLLTS